MANKFGMIVSSDRDKITKKRSIILDTQEKQFKYDKVIDLVLQVPAINAGSSWSKTINFNFRQNGIILSYAPMYQYRIKAVGGRWGRPALVSSQAYTGSRLEYPYFHGLEYITKDNFYLELSIQNEFSDPPFLNTYNYPPHSLILRLMLTHDELENV